MGSSASAAAEVQVGVVGTGFLGRHHVRNLAALPGAQLVGIHDLRQDTAEAVADEFGARVFSSLDALAEQVQAMVVAVPTVAHAEITCALLQRGIHVLVEKPMAVTLAEADHMLQAAAAGPGQPVLAVGHIEFYNPAVQALLEQQVEPRFVEVQRLGTFTKRSLDVDVVLDLMIHDLQILHALDPSPLKEVRATGIPVLSPHIDIANARIELASGCVANLTASRVSSEKVRKLRVFSRARYHSVDYQAQEIKGYRLETGNGEPRIEALNQSVEQCEPLRAELAAFLGACRRQPGRWVSGATGRQALATALEVVAAIGEVR